LNRNAEPAVSPSERLNTMSTKNSKTAALGEELASQNAGHVTENTLQFDPRTGELVVVNKQDLKALDPDVTVVDQIATDGFALPH